MKIKKKRLVVIALVLVIVVAVLVLVWRDQKEEDTPNTRIALDEQGRLIVNTSLFPVYDFAKAVGGERANVSLILPAGSEAHSFRPQEKDLDAIRKSALFFYTSDLMEPWAGSFKDIPNTRSVAAASGLDDGNDPHVWLDFSKASVMVDNIAAAYQSIDPQNASYYQENTQAYKQKLSELDAKFSSGLKDCRLKMFTSGGHYTFGYLAKRYGLGYKSVQGFVPDLNLDKDKLVSMGEELKKNKEPFVYYEELIMPNLAEILRQESGARLMPLNAAHNVGKYDIEGGVTFLSLMENDLKILESGLDCH